MNRYLVLPILFFTLNPLAQADNWPEWRGPTGNSVAAPGDFPTEFSNAQNVLWKTKLPGAGSSTPVVWEDRIFLTGGNGDQDSVQAYNWDGQRLWQKQLGPERPGKHKNGSGSKLREQDACADTSITTRRQAR